MQELIVLTSPIFIIILIGYILKLLNVIDFDFIISSNKMLFNFFLPLLLFYKIYSTSIGELPSFILLFIGVLSIFLIFFISLYLSKLFSFTRKEVFTVGMCSFRGNYAYMGLPVTYFFMGDHALKIAAIYMAFIVPVVNILSVISLAIGSKREIKIKEILKFSLSNAIVISCVVGLIFLFAGFKLPNVVDKSIDIVTQVTLPLALLNIGASFNFKYVASKIAPSILIILLKLLLLPAISLLIILFSKVEINVYCQVLIIMLSSPCASVNYILASSLEGDVNLTLSSIISTTILSIITYPLWYSIILNIAKIN